MPALALLLSLLLMTACRVVRPEAAPGRSGGNAPVAASPAGAVPAGGAAVSGSPSAGARFGPLSVERNLAVPMRDGVVLRADLYRPAAPGRYPTLVCRTPYGKDGLLESGDEPTLSLAPRAGYALLVEDVRGRFNSGGTFDPYRQEGKDGYDTIEWAAAQSWSDGRVGTFGLSYPGAVQWLAAMEAPPHLVSIFPAMTFATGRHFFYFGGAFNHDWMRWILLYIAPDLRVRGNLPGAKTEQEAQKEWDRRKWEWEGFLPPRALPVLADVAPWYADWMAHPDDGAYWAFADVTAAYDRITVPALNFTGWYDSNYGPLGAIANFNGVRAAGATEQARRGARLVIGPWDHGDPQPSKTKVGEIEFGPSATLDYYGLILAWHDRQLRGIHNDVDAWPPVRIFVMGDNVWRDEQEFPLSRARPTPYFLRAADAGGTAAGGAPAGAAAGSVRPATASGTGKEPGAGRLAPEAPAGPEAADRYDFDPRTPVRMDDFEKTGPRDQAPRQARRDVLSFTSEPLAGDLEVTGPIAVHLWIASSAIDTDFAVMLCDVHPDGRAYNLTPYEAGYLRTRYRNSESAPEMLTPGQPTELVLGGMVTSNVFKRGHRIRLQVTSSRFPTFDRNPNTGEPPESSSRMVTARQQILHDPEHPSRVILPVVPRD